MVKAYHYSSIDKLSGVDPFYHGTTTRGGEFNRGDVVQRSYWYLDGFDGLEFPEAEHIIRRRPHLYTAELVGLYDIGEDSDKLVPEAQTISAVLAGSGLQREHVATHLERLIDERDFVGFRHSKHPSAYMRLVACTFQRVQVDQLR